MAQYLITAQGSGIYSYTVSDAGTAPVAGAPFVPTPGPDNGEGGVQTEPDLLALSPNGAYLYALYKQNYTNVTLYSFHMVNGVPEQVSLIGGAGSPAYDGYGGQGRIVTASDDYVLMAAAPDDNSNGQGRLWVFRSIAGTLSMLDAGQIMPTVSNAWSLQIDNAEHFAYIGYNSTGVPPGAIATSGLPAVADSVAIYDISSFPAVLVNGAQPQNVALLIGAN